MGQLGAPYGVHGWIKLRSFTQPAENIQHYKTWHIKTKKADWQPIELTDIKTHQQIFIAKIANVNNPEEAALFTNQLIGITQQNLPKLKQGEYYWSDLIGLTVIDEDNNALGVIDHLFETGANDVMVVKDNKQPQLLPYHPSVVKSIDLEEKIMRVSWDSRFNETEH